MLTNIVIILQEGEVVYCVSKVIYKNTILLAGGGGMAGGGWGRGWRISITISNNMILWLRGTNFNITTISLHFYYTPYAIVSMAS